jgi:hypothetical protein
METNKGKIIMLDWGIFLFRGIFSWRMNREIPVEYTVTNMLLANLLKVGVKEEDTIMLATDFGKSWRKDFDVQYKADRKEKREAFQDINWTIMFEKMNNLLIKLDVATNWHVLREDRIECDDWMAYTTKYFPDKEVVLVTYDKDMEQLLARPNVKIFSPLSKKYKVDINPCKVLAEKIVQEKSDNLTNPVLNEEDYDRRNLLVNLLELPEFIEQKLETRLKNLEAKVGDSDEFPFTTLRAKYLNLCKDTSKIVTMEMSAKKKKKAKKRGKV